MLGFFERFERFLRLDRFTTKSQLMRARAVYMMGLAFLATQAINLATLYYTYNSLSLDHFISAVVCTLVVLCITSMRFIDRFQVYAGIYSVLIIGATLSSALNQYTGINSALIPFFILGVVVNGFICGWRAAITFGAVALFCIWGLWGISAAYDYTPLFDPESFSQRNFQRAVQASLATILISMVGAFFSKNMHDAFGELENAISAAQESDRAKTNFLATMSHELCTPMNGIIGMNDILQDTELDEDQRELTDIIRDSGRDLQTIINNVLLFSQLEAGRVSLDDSPFNIRYVISKAEFRYASAMEQKNILFEKHIADTIPMQLIGDKKRTLQIIEALIDNAVKFTGSGAIKIFVKGEKGAHGQAKLNISVLDSGIGIPTTHLEQIFNRFTQVDRSIKRNHGGTGLGLAVARDMAELMGGRISVKSVLGKGSLFTAHLIFDTPDSYTQNLAAAAE